MYTSGRHLQARYVSRTQDIASDQCLIERKVRHQKRKSGPKPKTMCSLAPLYRVDVYAFLYHFPQRTHFPEPVHCAHNPFNDKVDFRFSGETAYPEPQGTVRHVFGGTQSS
jgi:hypothetical protein